MIKHNQIFGSRREIKDLLGSDLVKGISSSEKAVFLFTNEEELYADYFYPQGTYDYCLYTGIGRRGHQDSLQNNMYDLNIEVLSHKKANKPLLMFEKRNVEGKAKYHFVGVYELTETHQNIQPDDNDELRRVFVFHLKKVADDYID